MCPSSWALNQRSLYWIVQGRNVRPVQHETTRLTPELLGEREHERHAARRAVAVGCGRAVRGGQHHRLRAARPRSPQDPVHVLPVEHLQKRQKHVSFASSFSMFNV